MRSRYAWLLVSFALAFVAAPLRAQPAPESAPAAPTVAPAVAPPPPPTPATPHTIAPPVIVPPPGVVPPPTYAAPPRTVYRATVPPPREKRRYGNAGAPFAFGIGADLRYRSDDGYETLDAKDRQTELDLFGSYDVYQPLRRVVLAAGLSYRHGALGDEDSLAIKSHAVQADAILRYRLTRWLFPQLRAGVGALLTRADLEDSTGDFRARDRSAGVTGSVGAGITLQTPPRLFETYRGRLASLCFGFLVEGGYIFASPVSYDLNVAGDSDLDSPGIALGELDQGGAYIRLSGVLRF